MTYEDDSAETPETLDDLIRYLETERNRLRAVVENAAKEWEFSEAKVYAKAYWQVSRRLQVLKSLRDPGFDERARYYRLMVELEEQLREYSKVPHVAKRLERELAEVNQALDKLEKARHFSLDTQYIDDALFDLVQGAISNFRIHLNKEQGLILHFECWDKQLHIRFSYKKRALWSWMKRGLRRLGFRKIEGAQEFIRISDVSDFKNAQPTKQLLAVLIFDVLGPSWMDSPVEMEINR